MSNERFEWLTRVGATIVRTPGCESNVKEVFDKTKSLKTEDPEGIVVRLPFLFGICKIRDVGLRC